MRVVFVEGEAGDYMMISRSEADPLLAYVVVSNDFIPDFFVMFTVPIVSLASLWREDAASKKASE